MPDRARAELPREFEEYRLVRLLGRGQMGQVYLAQDTLLDRPVAIKFLAALEPDAETRRRFFTEARAIARVQHPNVVSIHRVGEVRGCPYLVSEFVRGEGLDAVPRPMSAARVREIGIGLAAALAAAHRQGVLHRDVKPANAILSETGEVKLLDFGLAKFLDDEDAGAANPLPRLRRTAATMVALAETHISSDPSAPPARPGAPEAPARPDALPVTEPAMVAPAMVAPVMAMAAPALAPIAQTPLVPTRRTHDAPADGTAPGLLGTPLYLAPERWRGEPASRQSDIYAVGVLLYELASGRTPYLAPDLEALQAAVLAGAAPPLVRVARDIDPELAALVDVCLAPDPAQRPRSADELLLHLRALADAGTRPAGASSGPPYRGLAPFQAKQRASFFGRSADLNAVLERLRAQPFVLVLGDSGVGKSSLCRAGVLPALAEDGLDPGTAGVTWRTATCVPGRAPLRALGHALAPALGREAAAITWLLGEEPDTLARDIERRSASDGVRLAVFIDQLEELVTLAPPREAELAALALRALLAGAPSLRLLATARSDLLTRLLALPGLGPEATGALYPLAPLGPAALREAIVRPARQAGVSFEAEAMVDDLVAATARAPGGLPLLQFALAELWEARDEERKVIPAAALERMGGVEGALGAHAERVFGGLGPGEREAARQILTRLVTAEGTRARRTEAELGSAGADAENAAHLRGALEALVRGRLVVAGETENAGDHSTGDGAYEIAHEALLRGWPRLGAWLADDSDLKAVRERLERAAKEWQRLGRSREALLGARQLAEIDLHGGLALSAAGAAFLERSRRVRQRARLLRTGALVALPLLVAVVAVGVQLRQRHLREREVRARADEARVEMDKGARARAEGRPLLDQMNAAFDQGQTDSAEAHWSGLRARRHSADRAFAHAGQALERALALAPDRGDLHARAAHALWQRIELATEDGRFPALAGLLAELASHEPETRRATRLVDIEAPEATEVSLTRLSLEPGSEYQVQERRALGRAPLRGLVLPLGSYVFERAARAGTVRQAVLLAADTAPRVHIDLGAPAALPPGFVFVPAGEFLFGATTDEPVRRTFLTTSPLRRVKVPAYLVARHETTWAEWINFLEALPPAEQSRRMPRPPADGFSGAFALARRGGVWQLTVTVPPLRAQTVPAGAVLRLDGRPRRAEQDWRHLPVSGVSAGDVIAYAAWLDRAGKVPRARLCTEYEWERAARGADGRTFPHGNALDPDDANFDLTYRQNGGAPGGEPAPMWADEVGAHPASQSPFGLDDTVGNVWELVATSLGRGGFALRGGAFDQGLASLWLANRQVVDETYRSTTAGVRLCASRD